MEREILIKYHSDIPPIEERPGSDWVDLRSAEDTFIPVSEVKMISLGVSMQLPEGYEAHIIPRSSTFKNFGIIMINSMGLIDNSYCGDSDVWHFPALCLRGDSILNNVRGTIIRKGDRICQFRIMRKQPPLVFKEVNHLKNSPRGGFGSTGVK